MNENRWEGIDEFVAVAECGQFTAAAERLGVSSSHISRQVARLEERLQTRLFYRSTRRVTLTEAGQTFLQHCQRLQDGREEALRAIGDLASEPKGHAAHDLRCGLWRTLYRAAGHTRFMGFVPAVAGGH
jgi:DNA-binding transcriptional LysR family regulator